MQIKLGLLFSFTGTTSVTEKGQYDAACFAISKYNQENSYIDVTTRDICSDPHKAYTEAESLARDGVKVFIGCYTSACRQAILPVLEEYNCLLVYPTLYEGQEDHPHVFYTGEVPNQQVYTLVDYLMSQYGKRIYLLGNDYIYPHETNNQVKTYVQQKGGEVIEEKYVPFGHQDFHHTIQDIILQKPDAVFSTLVGQSVISFYQTFHNMNLTADTIPIFSPITKETKLEAMGHNVGTGHYSSASYFQSLDNPSNNRFKQDFYTYFGEQKAISSVMFNTYIGTKLILDSILESNSCHYEHIFNQLSGTKMETECGPLLIDSKKRHLSRQVKVGKALPTGQFNIVWDSSNTIKPIPYKSNKRKYDNINEVILQAWGQISEEAIIALSESNTIQYLSQQAADLTGYQHGDKLTPKLLQQLHDNFEVHSYHAKLKTLLLLKEHPYKHNKHSENFRFGQMQTKNAPFQHELETAKVAAQTTANVLITGETGTGKEVLAKTIHEESDRKDKPFIAVNTGALPKDLIISELFGYVEGSFTGAKAGGAIGKFESAHQGTLFLDEIGEMPLDLQVVLLRAIETKQIIRLGDTKERAVDIRIIAATNKALQEEIAYNNSFRSDLYYRLNVLSIDIPPLRHRPEDIEALIWLFLEELTSTYGDGPTHVDDEVLQLLIEYPWPGNIRELRNVMERAFLLSKGKFATITTQHIPESNKGYYTRKIPTHLSLKEVEQKMITHALQETNNVDAASRKLGIGRSTLYRKIKEFDISM